MSTTREAEDALAGNLLAPRSFVILIRDRRVDDRARLFGIEVLHQLGRAVYVGEQRGDGLALAFG